MDFKDFAKNFDMIYNEATGGGPKKHILAVDDDREVLKLLKAVLSDRYDVTTVTSGRTAMKFLESRGTDLILLDYYMPGESGAEVLKHLRMEKKTTNIPVVFLTGMSTGYKVKEILSHKSNGYLLKPVDVSRLLQTVKDIIG